MFRKVSERACFRGQVFFIRAIGERKRCSSYPIYPTTDQIRVISPPYDVILNVGHPASSLIAEQIQTRNIWSTREVGRAIYVDSDAFSGRENFRTPRYNVTAVFTIKRLKSRRKHSLWILTSLLNNVVLISHKLLCIAYDAYGVG